LPGQLIVVLKDNSLFPPDRYPVPLEKLPCVPGQFKAILETQLKVVDLMRRFSKLLNEVIDPDKRILLGSVLPHFPVLLSAGA
jgi:hypothetical protein